MAVAIAAETGVAILIGCNLDVVLGNSGGFLNGAELGVNQKAELILGGIGNQSIASMLVTGYLNLEETIISTMVTDVYQGLLARKKEETA